jgi:protein O-mannosyl-transferase
MGKKNIKQFKNQQIADNKVINKSDVSINKSNNLTYYFLLAAIVAITIVSFSSSFNNKFVNWDDNVYVVENQLIKDISPKGLIEIFKSYANDQLPLTQLSLAINYHFSELNEKPYHVVNLIFHILNLILVFQFIKILTKRNEIAIIAALLFAIHPLRVESVTWTAERKDVQFTFFYLCSLITYLKYLNSGRKTRFLIFSIFFSVLSYLSKLMAISLPVILILIDFYYSRKFTIKSIAEKLPFFIIPFISGIIHYITPTEAPMVQDIIHKFTFIDTLFFACYCLSFYLLKFIFPINIYALYPYPVKTGGFLPVEYYLAPVLIIVLVFLFIKYYKVLISKGRDVLFGILFFIVTISLVLQVIPFGGRCITADRYTYIPYIGLFLIIGKIYTYFIDKRTKLTEKIRPYLLYFFIGVTVIFSIQTYNRNKVWYNSMSLWNDVIEKNPNVAVAYADRGMAKSDMGDYQGAVEDCDKAISIEGTFSEAYYNRGVAKDKIGSAIIKEKFGQPGSEEDIKRAFNIFYDAIKDFSSAIKLKPKFVEAYYNRGNVYKDLAIYGNNVELQKVAVENYTKALEVYPAFYSAFNNRGVSRYMLNDYQGTINDLNVAIRYDPHNGLYYCIRGYAKYKLQMSNEACKDWNLALQYGCPDTSVTRMVYLHCNK